MQQLEYSPVVNIKGRRAGHSHNWKAAVDMATSVRSCSSLSGILPKAVGAIDFGTSNTCIAFGMRPTYESEGKFRVQLVTEWEDGKGNPDMAPTSILFNKAEEMVAYGFAAEKMFKNHVGEEYYFFKNFKMDLHSKEVSCKVQLFIKNVLCLITTY